MPERRCPSCAAAVPAGARFCANCGAPMSHQSDERRIVTVLFADVVGFTPLSEVRDPEHVKNLLDRCFERLAADVTSHGGRVDKIVGDEIMAVFGAPIAHEDDPERAVRSALQMQRTLTEHAEETGADVRMRIGINTGEVLVGALRAGGDVTALGDVVNTANRLQTSAQPSEVLVGPDTHLATSEVISYEELGSLTVKGREAPVEAWRALQALGPPGSRPGRVRSPLIGRKSEVAVMWHALSTAVAHARPHFVLLVGDAGMGKTMLVDEAIQIAQAQHDARVIQGRCLPYGEANPWWPIAEALREACDIDPEDPADVAADKCRRAIGARLGPQGEGAEASRVSDGLLYIMGYEGALQDLDPSRAREEAIRAIQLAVAANARERPLVIVLSEIHWADQLVLDLVDAMFDRLRNLPIVLIATARPDIEERWMPKFGRYNLFVVNLDPLDREESAELVRGLLCDDNASPDLVELIVERSGGNPLFISELVAMVGEAGFGRVSGDRLDGPELPATLRGLVSARLDALPREDRSVLEDAAVVGRNGPVTAVLGLSEGRGESGAKSKLAVLAHKDFIVLGDGTFEFRSDLVRDVAYETLTKSERARRHAALGTWLAAYASKKDREDEYLERIAHHHAQAAQLAGEVGIVDGIPSDILEQALAWLDRAAARAEARETTGVSVHLLEHALELAGDSNPELRARFLLGRARGRAGQRDLTGAKEDAAAVLTIAQHTSSDVLRAQGLAVLGEVQQREGTLELSAATLKEAVEVWRKTGDRRGEAEALRLWGFTSIHRGELDAAEHAISEALDISRDLADRRGEAWALQNLAWAAFSRGENDLAEQRLTASANLFEEIGDFGGQGWAFGLLGYVWYFKGRLEDAGYIAEQGIRWIREIGDKWGSGMMVTLLAMVRLWQGRTREAIEHAKNAHRLFEEIDDTMGLVFSGMHLAIGLVMTGSREEGLELAYRYRPKAEGVFAGGPAGVLGTAALHTLLGEPDEALAVIGAEPEGHHDPDIAAARGLALFLAGRGEDAYESASRAVYGSADVGPRSNGWCILALTAAAAGRPEEAVRVGDEVGGMGVTYLDHVRAHLARAFGYAQLGEEEHLRAALDSARRIVDATEDDLHRALVRLAEGTVASSLGADLASDAEPINSARDSLEKLGVKWRPWERAFRLALAGGRSESVVTPASPV